MSLIICPPIDEQPWPTLGPQVCDFIEELLCHGPGDLLGQPVKLTPEHRAWIYRMYEVEPRQVSRGGRLVPNPRAGKRRFNRSALSLRKGSSKTEFAAWIAAAELHPDGPVRCDGWDAAGNPVGRGVTDPYIPMISSTEEQTEELAYGALRRILEEAPSGIGADFDIGLERILRISGNGKAEAVSASPNARDGARTTFQHADETHRFELDSLKRAWKVMLANLAKRPGADPWALETTTAHAPGALSVAENTFHYAEQLLKEKDPSKSKLFFFHRQASEELDLSNKAQLKEAVIEASGPYIAQWSDVDRIVDAFYEPDADANYLARVWLNQPTQSSGIAFSKQRWRELSTDFVVPDGDAITLGFDGHRYDKAAALIATHVNTGFQWPLGIWEHDPEVKDWEVDLDEVNGAIADAFERYHVCRFYADPPNWETSVAQWAGKYDQPKRKVYEWWTNRRAPMGAAVRSFANAITGGELTHSGDTVFAQHIGSARKVDTNLMDEGKPLWLLREERPGAPIDAANAAVLSWEARNDAVAAGENVEPEVSYDLYFVEL